MKTHAMRCIQAALAILAAVSCSGSVDVGKLQQPLQAEPGPVKLVACGDLLLATDPVKPASELDYIGLYQQFRPDYVVVVSDQGEVCRGAQDQDACIAEVAARLTDSPTCATADVHCKPFVITTHGGDVQSYSNPEELARMLGDVDTASEAVLIAQLHGLSLTCSSIGNKPAPGTLVQATGAGWRLQSQIICGGLQSIEIHEDGSSPGLEYNPSGATGGCP